MSSLSSEIKEELQMLMAALGVNQVELQKRTGMPQTGISRIFQNDREIRLSTIELLAAGLGKRARIIFEDLKH